MWIQPGDGNRAAASGWWLADTMFVQPWKTAAGAIGALLRRAWPGRDRFRVSSLSEEWLREHEAEAGKHRGDP